MMERNIETQLEKPNWKKEHTTNTNPAKSVTLRKRTDTSRVKKSRHDCAHAKDTGQVTKCFISAGLAYFVLISFLHKAKKN